MNLSSKWNQTLSRCMLSNSRLAILTTITILAFTTRILPRSISSLPFNNDGISECRIASDIIMSGHLDYPEGSFYLFTHAEMTQAYDILLAATASALGVTPFAVAQVVVSVLSIVTIVGIYLVSLRITRSVFPSLMAALTLSLLGTFAFITGSTWKESLGVAMLVLLTYAYMSRHKRNMFALEIVILAVFPIVHHYVALLAYISIAALTLWSVFYAIISRRLQRRHLVDSVVLGMFVTVAYLYYRTSSLDRFSYIVNEGGIPILILSFAVVVAATMIFLMRRSHSRYTFAPIPAVIVLCLFVYDYFSPIFPYSQGFPVYILVLGLVSAFVASFAWFGFESILETGSWYRAIPLGMLVPVLTLMLYAFVTGLDRMSHQIVYRTFDFADPALAVGVACAVACMGHRPSRKALLLVFLAALLVSFPFGYATNTLTGIRHDTQSYEVDAVTWIYTTSNHTYSLHSDERISYNARAYYDYSKCPSLPSELASEVELNPTPWYILLKEWTTIGVNNYPNGYLILDEEYVSGVLSRSDVYYVGGPLDNNIVVFSGSSFA